ncbi:methyltransferase [Gimesia panareensis]|uniref:Multifunctional cyclase-dehydratase-3-O-methyl transferase TcmN n=1 Tax=Gimesia panareensis TaxID=2527978 RepID=A0A518ABH3_9PLAN|nr:methyltransferase [Gimesia panareensis]QDT29192.1 Multifunctional cyclase-dehydratase-3-O-methyl transferase TcmN [Gimesia panareensis]QDU52044.1 Multifunctional cyclase-dehydratase-3-O-methyl transferase TcmN [Gimesia panareensis]
MTEHALHQQLDQMITGYWSSQAIYAAAKLGIADLLTEGPQTAEQLAVATETHAGALYRVLRALASVGIFAENQQQEFTLTPMAEYLRSDVPGSKRALAMMSGDEQFQCWSEIMYSVQTGKTSFDKVFGQPIFEYLSQHPDKGQIFDKAMTGIHGRETDEILQAYDFSGIETLVDVGGGNGSNLIHILQKYPDMQGILFDLPHVVERAQPHIEQAGVDDRCEMVGGNFFESVPANADTWFMRHIIHDWDDEKSLTILKNCHAVMPEGSKLLIVESVIPAGNDPFAGKFLDLVMLMIPGGKERTTDEYRALFDQAGFELVRIIPTESELSIIEFVKK